MITKPPTVLVVEDEHHIRDILMYSLRNHNYDVIVTETAEEGMEALEDADDVDLILLNLHLPKMSGEDFLRSIREKGYYTPVIIITASMGREEGLEKFGHYEIVDFIEKPFRSKQVVDRVDCALKTAHDIKFISEATTRLNGFIKRQESK